MVHVESNSYSKKFAFCGIDESESSQWVVIPWQSHVGINRIPQKRAGQVVFEIVFLFSAPKDACGSDVVMHTFRRGPSIAPCLEDAHILLHL